MKAKPYLKVIFVVASFGLGLVFILRQMFPSGSLEYRYVRTEEAVVTSNVGQASIARSRNPSVMVQTKSGLIVRVMHPTQNRYAKGDIIKVDLYKAKGRKVLYRLAQEPIQP